jgi:hypothetical protein
MAEATTGLKRARGGSRPGSGRKKKVSSADIIGISRYRIMDATAAHSFTESAAESPLSPTATHSFTEYAAANPLSPTHAGAPVIPSTLTPAAIRKRESRRRI